MVVHGLRLMSHSLDEDVMLCYNIS